MQTHIKQSIGIAPLVVVPSKNLILRTDLHQLLTINDKRLGLMDKIAGY